MLAVLVEIIVSEMVYFMYATATATTVLLIKLKTVESKLKNIFYSLQALAAC